MGPDMKSGASSQALKAKGCAPAFGFGTASREQVNKLFVSQEHTLIATGGHHSPGPAAYALPASVGGKQPDGRKADPPVWRFSGAERFSGYGKTEKKPGPDEYNLPASVGGQQPDGARENAPMYGFGSATRDQVRKLFIMPSDLAATLSVVDHGSTAQHGNVHHRIFVASSFPLLRRRLLQRWRRWRRQWPARCPRPNQPRGWSYAH